MPSTRTPPAANRSRSQPAGGLPGERLGQDAARHARLVRDEHDAEAVLLQHPQGLDGVRVQVHAVHAADVAVVLDQRAVAIDEHRRVAAHARPPRARYARVASTTCAGVTRRMQR